LARHTLHNEFTATIERDEKWYIGYCPEIPGANGQGETVEGCKRNIAETRSCEAEAGLAPRLKKKNWPSPVLTEQGSVRLSKNELCYPEEWLI
jgi:hypothetical protein